MRRSPISNKSVVIIGAGPAGLTAAYELLKRSSDYDVTIIERGEIVGGLSRTVKKGSLHLDIGGHRFYSKSPEANRMFAEIMPIQSKEEHSFLKRKRLSRIFYRRKLFEYPLKLDKKTLMRFGALETFLVACSYLKSLIFVRSKPENLEQFFIKRFGRRLYKKFFKGYSEKIWGIACHEIDASWGEQRIKAISLWEFAKALLSSEVESEHTSLIDEFLYPKKGPGQFWECVRDKVIGYGGKIFFEEELQELSRLNGKWIVKSKNNEFVADYVLSTINIKNLMSSFSFNIPKDVQETAQGLEYRDFMTVGLHLSHMNEVDGNTKSTMERGHNLLPDNWLYIQEPESVVGRVQIFNNWSPHMVEDLQKPWLGLEYFCQEGDRLWQMSDKDLTEMARLELVALGFINQDVQVLDSLVVKAPKAYPKYTGAYKDFDYLRDYLLELESFYTLGRNGMHRYNNQDHSMVAAMRTVDHLLGESSDKMKPWTINLEQEYLESKDA
jgi:protoporphyrinogen oxidase